MAKRVCCLYRVSTDKQVDYDSNHEADIPMQRKACHKFAEKMGWEIVHEEQEDGVSGHKVRAENRDKIQIIKELARKKQFDILLVFMFDRIGRIADETPFVVEWFVKTILKCGAPKRANSVLIIILTSFSTISVFGRQTAKVRKPQSVQKQASVRWSRKDISRAALPPLDMTLLKAAD